MATAGTVTIQLDANSARLVREMAKAQGRTARFARSSARELQFLGGVARTVIGVVVVGALTRMTTTATKTATALVSVSDKLGIATDKLAGLQLAGELTNVQNEKLTLGIQRMTRRIAEAAQGTGEAQGAIKQLGLDAQALNALSPDEQFIAIANAMAQINNQSDKVRLGFKLFDSEGVDLIRTLELGEEGIRAAQQEAVDFGLAISRIDAEKLEQVRRASIRARAALQGTGIEIAVGLAPFVTAIADEFIRATRASEGFSDEIETGLRITARAVGVLLDGLRGLQVIFNAVRTGATGLAAGLFEITAAIIELNDKIPAITPLDVFEFVTDTDPTEEANRLRERAANLRQIQTQLRDDLVELLNQPIPSSGVDEVFDRIINRANEAAAEAAQAATGTSSGVAIPLPSQEELDELRRQLVATTVAAATESAERRKEIESLTRESIIKGEEELQGLLQELLIQQAEANVNAKIEAEKAARAAAGLPEEGPSELERQKLLIDELLRLAAAAGNQRVQLEDKISKERIKIEQAASRAIIQTQRNTLNAAVGFLQSFAGESRAAAIAVVLINKGRAIAEAIQNTAVAVTKALALDPTGSLAARVKALGAAQIALIAATGVGEIAGIGGGGAALGTAPNPIRTQPADSVGGGGLGLPEDLPRGFQGRPQVQVVFQGDVVAWDDFLRERVIRDLRTAIDEGDEVIFSADSQQAFDLIEAFGNNG